MVRGASWWRQRGGRVLCENRGVKLSRIPRGWLFVLVALTTLAVSIAVSLERRLRRGVPAWALGAVLFVVALAASFTGYLLPWDQLALWAVTVGTNMQGYRPVLHGGVVHFVLLGGVEVSRATLVRWFWVHTAVIPPVLVVIGWFAGRRRQAAAVTP